ncbi:DNA-binding protein [Candidatus Bathyarchaeota archaeon]|nr:MAG: DNA-binding protein [Candidatus Bathyarchaeota archaeon]
MPCLHIGLDDTDSPRKGCTTYIAALLVEKLVKINAKFIDYPNLIRLNPNVPWKTRGNGALCLRIQLEKKLIDKVKEFAIDTVEEYSDLEYEGTDPGIVFFQGRKIPEEIREFAKNTIQGVVKLEKAINLIKKFKAEAFGFKKCRGIIGALAAVGETLDDDYTYEIIAYRVPENYGKPRQIDEESVRRMDEATRPYTFNNVDPATGRILITPRGPDPILYGIRGESPEVVKKAHEMVKALEPIERWVIFRTNHGTDAHLRRVQCISMVRPYHPVIVRGIVSRQPRVIPRRHVIFAIKDESGEIDCAAYEPTGNLRKIARKLMVGDLVEVYGGVRPPSEKNPLTINLEKLKILKLVPKIVYVNPLCPKCGKRMKSMGAGKGFRCEKCGFRSREVKKIAFEEERDLKEGIYVSDPRSERHLTKPLQRYGLEKKRAEVKLIDEWFGYGRSNLVEP